MDIETIETKLRARISKFIISVIKDSEPNQILISVTSDEPFSSLDKMLISSEVMSVVKNGIRSKLIFKALESYNA